MGHGTVESAARATLAQVAAEWSWPLADERASALLRFGELLMEWNARINLTGARTIEKLIADHYPDAFALASALGDPAEVVDVGSGGGLPAIPLGLLRPQLRLTLVEPLAKKAAFLRTAVRELSLGAAVANGRAEDEPPGRYDVALSRATFSPPEWAALARRLVRSGGRIFVLTVPETDLPGRRTDYLGGRRTLIEIGAGERST